MADVRNTQAIFAAMLESKASRKVPAARKIESKNVKNEALGASMFTGRLLRESVENEDVVEDIIDNIVVVTDPDKTVDDLENRADDIQDAIEGSPEGEAAFSDEYVGDKVYACPICGESFFADNDFAEGDVCPICKAEPNDGFLCQGVVAAVEPEEESPVEEIPEEEISTEDDLELPAEDEGNLEDSEGVEAEADDIDIADDEEIPAEESYNKVKTAQKAVKENDEPAVEIEIEVNMPEAESAEDPAVMPGIELDETTFNSCLNQFAEENYGDCIDNFEMVGATYSPAEDALKFDCNATTKAGDVVPVALKATESSCEGDEAVLEVTESTNIFKIESKKPAFRFKVRKTEGIIRCESMKYGFVTTHSKAGKVKVEGLCRAKSGKNIIR